jgi:GT2 family glycosyltransferase
MARVTLDVSTKQAAAAELPGHEPLLAVIIVTYESAAVLPGVLNSLRAGLRGIGRYRVLVVDNNSLDGSPSIADNHELRPEVIRMGRNAGYAAAINAAAAFVGPDANLLILNPDIRLLPQTARILCNTFADPSVGVAVPKIFAETGEISRSLRREPSIRAAWADALLGTRLAAWLGAGEIVADPKLYSEGGGVEWATGAMLAVSARARHMVGAWDETFFLYSEEVDYLQRMRRQGFRIVYVPAARAIHIGGAYHDNTFLAALMTTNRIRYFRRHHNLLATVLFRLSIIVGEMMRAPLGRGHRAALRAAMTARS